MVWTPVFAVSEKTAVETLEKLLTQVFHLHAVRNLRGWDG